MTGNRFDGEICVYCNNAPSATDDHVFAKKFFISARRDNLPQVPCCQACNGAKAKLESELMPVLPFGGRHTDATANLTELTPRRLDKNARIARRIRTGRTRTLVREKGIIFMGSAVPLDWIEVEELFTYIARGVAWHEFDHLRFGPEHFVEAHTMIGHVGRVLRHLQQLRAGRRVDVDLGRQTFRYTGAQSASNPHITVWEFEIYGGLRSELSADEPCNIGVTTGPAAVRDRGAAMALTLNRWRRGTRLHNLSRGPRATFAELLNYGIRS